MLAATVISDRRDPWNKGKLVGQKAPLKLRDILATRVRVELGDRKRELALFNLAIDSKLRVRMLPTAIGSPRERSSCNRRPSGRFSSKSRSRHENQSSPGFGTRPSKLRTICFQAGCGSPGICRPGNTPESSRLGSPKSAWTPTPVEPIPCAARRPR